MNPKTTCTICERPREECEGHRPAVTIVGKHVVDHPDGSRTSKTWLSNGMVVHGVDGPPVIIPVPRETRLMRDVPEWRGT